MKVKVFSATESKQLEKQINDWIESGIEVEDLEMVVGEAHDAFFHVIATYEQKKSKKAEK